jgi:hypothetical protein
MFINFKTTCLDVVALLSPQRMKIPAGGPQLHAVQIPPHAFGSGFAANLSCPCFGAMRKHTPFLEGPTVRVACDFSFSKGPEASAAGIPQGAFGIGCAADLS